MPGHATTSDELAHRVVGSSVSLANVTKRYVTGRGDRVLALNDVSLEVHPGEFLTLLGPSGCGKSTTLRCIAGLDTPDEGTIAINGSIVADKRGYVPAHKRDVGMVFQSYAIWPHMTVGENVAYPLRYRGSKNGRGALTSKGKKDLIASLTAAALEAVGLWGLQDRWAGELSGGQQQRVAFARAIVASPGLVLLDEPLSNLDAQLRRQMRGELRRLAKLHGFTTVYVTHDQVEALAVSDRIVLMRGGAMEQSGTTTEVYERPASRFAAEFMSTNLITISGTLRAPVAPGDVATIQPEAPGVRPTSLVEGRFMSDRHAAAGQAVDLLVRTHHVSITPADTTPDEHHNAIPGALRETQFLGERYESTVALDDGTSVIVSSATAPMAGVGSSVLLTFNADDVFVFHGEEGQEA